MDRRTLVTLFKLPRTTAASAIGQGVAPSADAVYEAARALRARINAALAASRIDVAPTDSQG